MEHNTQMANRPHMLNITQLLLVHLIKWIAPIVEQYLFATGDDEAYYSLNWTNIIYVSTHAPSIGCTRLMDWVYNHDSYISIKIILAAVANGDITFMEYLIDKYYISSSFIRYANAFACAWKLGHVAIAQLIVRKFGSSVVSGPDLSIALQEIPPGDGQFTITRWLVDDGHIAPEIVRSINKLGYNELVKACKNGHTNIVVWLFKNLGMSVEDVRANCCTALVEACKNGHTNIVVWLFKNLGMSVEDVRANGYTALVEACKNGHINIVVWLFKNLGMSVMDVRAYGCTALVEACKNGHINIVDWLVTTFEITCDDLADQHMLCRRGALFEACNRGQLAVVQWLIQRLGMTVTDSVVYAMLEACTNGHLVVAQWIATELQLTDADVLGITMQDPAVRRMIDTVNMRNHVAVSIWLNATFGLH
jgi:ankyrin repeat protein